MWLEGQEEGRREGLEWVVWAWVVCVGERREEEGGREREGRVGDAGFVLPVAYVKNLNCCCLS